MKIELATTSRRPSWPTWAVVLVLAWLTLVGITSWVGASTGRSVHLCLFKQLTGLPCPTCGLTRGTFCLLRGEPIAAWLRNPFLFSALAVFCLATVVRIVFARAVRIHLGPTQGRVLWSLLAAAFLANWLYLILYVG